MCKDYHLYRKLDLLGNISTFAVPAALAQGLKSTIFIMLYFQFFSLLPKELSDEITPKNIIMKGSTGVGKTYLTNCIANEVLKLGKTVLYQTAPVMFDEINDAKFGRENARFDLYENILNVDLLIIDDLGTEKITDTKITELFTIINTRLLNQNHKITKTIISTNLTANELFSVYTTRIGSRLAGSYRFLRFFGEDIRLKKGKKEL